MKQTEINNIWKEKLMQTKYLFQVFFVSAFMLAIAGCGGGGGGGSAAGAAISSVPDNPSPPSGSGSATLTWDQVTENTDNSQLTDLSGYIVYYGTSSNSYSYSSNLNINTLSDPFSPSSVISNLSLGTWYFAVTAYNSIGNESVKSDEISVTVL